MKKFDFVVGNPPYQDNNETNNRSKPIYPYFYEASENISNKYVLISPARFLSNTGLTSKSWNEKMLTSKHIKVLKYIQLSSDVFENTDIKGGLVIMLGDSSKKYKPIEIFIPNHLLKSILLKVNEISSTNFNSIMHGGRSSLKFNNDFIKDYPNSIEDRLKIIQTRHPNVKKLSVNEEYELKSSSLEVLPYVFHDREPNNINMYYKITGLFNNQRKEVWIEKKYMNPRYENNNINSYKIFVPESNGSGAFGEVLSSPFIGYPRHATTPTFISIGNFNNLHEAKSCLAYLKTKFLRTLLSIKKVTQHNPPKTWEYVPLQDFTENSDIDWSKSIAEIDQQLYKKYDLSPEEIDFIEEKVQEME